jgi:hypothetical protein
LCGLLILPWAIWIFDGAHAKILMISRKIGGFKMVWLRFVARRIQLKTQPTIKAFLKALRSF